VIPIDAMTERTARATRASNTPPSATNGKTHTSPAIRPAVPPVKRARRSTAIEGAPGNAHDRKREQILDVAVNLFFKHGYAGTTIADIADKLGVTKPFVYYYFENKEDLFETLTWEASNACMTALHFPTADKRRAIEKLREGLTRLVLANIKHLKAGTFYYRETGILRAPFLRKLRVLGRRFHTDLSTLLEAGQREGDLEFDNAKLTALKIGSVVGFMYAWYRPAGPIGATEMAERLCGTMLRMAGAKSGTRTAAKTAPASKENNSPRKVGRPKGSGKRASV
jgi:AcrR family transcriptional regulator